MGSMWKQLWKKWTLDKPAAFGDLLWDVLVVQFAAFLSRLTLRRVIAVIPLVILILAYAHSIPVPPELMLLGDLLAYIDIFTVIFLLGVLSRVATVLYLLKQAAAHVARLTNGLGTSAKRLDFRHRREGGAKRWKNSDGGPRSSDDECAPVYGIAWA
jgi:hypothetical protein